MMHFSWGEKKTKRKFILEKRFYKAVLFMSFLLIPSLGYAQVTNVDLRLNRNNPVEDVAIQVPDGRVEVLRLTAYDPDRDDEGQLYINGQGPIDLFPGGNGANDGQTVDIDIRLNDSQRAWFVPGNNVLRFTHVRSSGYRIESIITIGEISVKEYAAVAPVIGSSISANRSRALEIYKRLVGVTTSIDNPILAQMEAQLDAGDALAAARLATQEPGFYNLVVRDMAAKMSTREETVKTSFNDFIASFIGVTRDGLDARLLLTGNFFYMGNSGVAVPNDVQRDIVESNNHYLALEADNYDFASVLGRVNSQYVRAAGGNLVAMPDPAGVITSRTFMEAHATAGTNRRLVEYTMRQFTCNPMENWADATSSDAHVGRDVDRFPGGEASKFQTTCKSCHSNMDAFRGAFARVDFNNGFTKYSTLYPDGSTDDPDAMPQDPIDVSSKLNHNNDVFPAGHTTLNDSWKNFARSPANNLLFGWRGSVADGRGINQFATAVANSKAFSQCMVKRVFTELCRREPASFEIPVVQALANQFEGNNYRIKDLFETIAIRPECIGR